MELSKSYVEFLVKHLNSILYKQGKKLKIVTEDEELPSQKPRTLHQFGYNKIRAFAKAFDEEWFVRGFMDTNSMEPSVDEGHIGIFSPPPNQEDLQVGDVILFYRRLDNSPSVMHRIYEIGEDDIGWYCITIGDNLVKNDGKTRYKDILGLLRIVVY